MNKTLILFACLALVLLVASPCAAQSPTPLPLPCSSAANKTLADACLLTLALTHLHYEETGQWEPLLDTMSDDAYEIYGHTLMGGVNTAPDTSDQSLYHMYANILNGGQPDDLVYVPVTTTIGTNTIVYEYVTVFNHTKNFWLVPYPATNRMVSVGMVLTLGFDDNNKMTYERFFVDSASILVQIGILKDGYGVYGNDLAAPYPPGKACKRHLPVAADQFASILINGPYDAGVEFNTFYVNEAENLSSSSSSLDESAHARDQTGKRHKRQEQRQYDSFSALVMADLANLIA